MSEKGKELQTPEEREAGLARRDEKKELFGRSFEKALILLLGLLLVFSVAHIAFH